MGGLRKKRVLLPRTQHTSSIPYTSIAQREALKTVLFVVWRIKTYVILIERKNTRLTLCGGLVARHPSMR